MTLSSFFLDLFLKRDEEDGLLLFFYGRTYSLLFRD